MTGERLKQPINFQGRTVVGFRVPGSFGGFGNMKNRGREYMEKTTSEPTAIVFQVLSKKKQKKRTAVGGWSVWNQSNTHHFGWKIKNKPSSRRKPKVFCMKHDPTLIETCEFRGSKRWWFLMSCSFTYGIHPENQNVSNSKLIPSRKLTASLPLKNDGTGRFNFHLGWPIFRGQLAVSFGGWKFLHVW